MNDLRTLLVSTVNLDHFPDDRGARLEMAAAELLRHRFDVVLVQEASDHNGENTAELLARRCGMTLAVRTAQGNAVLSRLPVSDVSIVELGSADAAAAVVDAGCHRFLMVSTHLSWGTGRENVRLDEVMKLDAWVSERAPLDPQRVQPELYAMLGGDLNSEPDSATVRWLHGLDVHEGRSTLWVDAWRAGRGPGYTSTPENPFAARTAATVGIARPDLLPARRIDHLLSRGYAHGRVGSPLEAYLLGRGNGRCFGDHYGVGASFLC
jgi:endonuclease/exonuclease/phosphatase family metal-dependent hydrolase